MKITADTNILVRFIVRDDEKQADAAARLLENAKQICVPTTVFCELSWVLSYSYGYAKTDIAKTIRALLEVGNLVCVEDEVAAGLEQLEFGGDFADGINEYAGSMLGASRFATFDKKAVSVLKKRGIEAVIPSKHKP